MIKGWGKTLASVLLAASAVTTATACSGAADAPSDGKPAATRTTTKAAAKPVTAQWRETMDWWVTHDIGCLNGSSVDENPEGCAIRLQDYVDDVRKIRKAMNTDPAAPKGFYTEAYVIIDRIETYAATPVGEDDTAGWLAARPLIWMEGADLDEWIAAHPTQ
ncbi:hypothetical protein [Streptomyces sp. NPDC056399]|uniref:hypothetical protein n=1 Tax=Streptomyces sp. NPDC056399 TaxID=3345807 RepID=UPI0035E3B4A4